MQISDKIISQAAINPPASGVVQLNRLVELVALPSRRAHGSTWECGGYRSPVANDERPVHEDVPDPG